MNPAASGVESAERDDLDEVVLPRAVDQRHVDDLDRGVARRVEVELLPEAKVDHGAHAVLDDRRPARLAQPARVLGADERAAPRLASILGGQAAELADVDEAVPGKCPHAASSTPR